MSNKKTAAVYPGTFDPITLGHLDIIQRARKLFPTVIVAVTDNPEKNSFFSLEERIQLTKEVCKNLSGVKVEHFSGLLVNFLKKKKSSIIVRGLRELSDFEFEFQQAVMNRKLDSSVDTVFIMTDPRYFYVSSSMVRQIASLKGDIAKLVPKQVKIAVLEKINLLKSLKKKSRHS